MIEDGLCYLTLTDKAYPKRLAFLYLGESEPSCIHSHLEEAVSQKVRVGLK